MDRTVSFVCVHRAVNSSTIEAYVEVWQPDCEQFSGH